MIEQLSSGPASQEFAVKVLQISLWTLQRHLRAEGTGYKELLEQTRRDLAARYVKESHLSVGEITFLLGFSEPANFARAFKRWHGNTPTGYRAM